MKKRLLTLAIAGCYFMCRAQAGIGTLTPHASAVLELQATDKGFKGPEVALLNRLDQTTIIGPERGLIVFNTANAGVSPNQVYANRYYFWNGAEWVSLPGFTTIEELVLPRVFYAKSAVAQSFSFSSTSQQLVLSFETIDLNTLGIITPSAGNTFRINKSGLYEVSSVMNYNPNGASSNRALQNLIIEKGSSASGPWAPIAGARGNWGRGSASDFKTIVIPITAVQLVEGEFIRVITSCPYPSGDSEQGTAIISTTTNTPIAKSLNIRLIDFNL